VLSAFSFILQVSSVFVADEVKDGTRELGDVSKRQRTSSNMALSDRTETALHERALKNLHFILCVSPVSLFRYISADYTSKRKH